MMKHLVWILLLGMGWSHAVAQEVYTSSGKTNYHKKKKKGFDPAKVIIGGEPTAAGGSGYVDVGISGILGYKLTKHFAAGIGLGYLYSQVPDYIYPTNYSFKENVIYPNVWTQYAITRNWFVTAAYEYDIIYASGPGYDGIHGYPVTIKTTADNNCLFIGGGYRAPLGGRAFWYIEALHDLIQGINSPYTPGLITALRIGVGVGI